MMARKTVYVCLLGLTEVLVLCTARSWTDVVDPAIYIANTIDLSKMTKSFEQDPFLYHSVQQLELTSVPSSVKVVEKSIPTLVPSSTPTARYEMVANNGGCKSGTELYKIFMFDSWGDGWNSATIKIMELPTVDSTSISEHNISKNQTKEGILFSSYVEVSQTMKASQRPVQVFVGTMETGSQSYSYVCLDATKCYEVTVDGGDWEEEIKWDIQKASLGVPSENPSSDAPVAKGLAPVKCQFSLPDPDMKLVCPSTCGISANTNVLTESKNFVGNWTKTYYPSAPSSITPTIAPSIAPSSEDTFGISSSLPTIMKTNNTSATSEPLADLLAVKNWPTSPVAPSIMTERPHSPSVSNRSVTNVSTSHRLDNPSFAPSISPSNALSVKEMQSHNLLQPEVVLPPEKSSLNIGISSSPSSSTLLRTFDITHNSSATSQSDAPSSQPDDYRQKRTQKPTKRHRSGLLGFHL